MIAFLRKRYIDLGLLIIRVLAGFGIMTHGYSKLFEWGVSGFIDSVAGMGFPLPGFFGWAAALSEFLGGILLILGLGTRIAGFFIACTMFVAVVVRHAGESFGAREKALLYFTIATSLLAMGGGRYSLDYYLNRWRKTLRKEVKTS